MSTLKALRSQWPVSTIELHGARAQILRTTGGGVPVLWLHGAVGTAEVFFKQFMAWGATRNLVALNLPPLVDGHALGEFVISCADALDIERFDLVGTSLGGYVAQWVAVDHAMRLRRLVVGNSFRDAAPLQTADKLHALEKSSAETVAQDALARIQAEPGGELKQVQLTLMSPASAGNMLRSRLLAVQQALPLPPLAIPDRDILLVECDNDPLIPANVRKDLRDAHPGARVVDIPDGGHYPYILRVDAYNTAVGQFLGM
ncbi:MAG: hypothetical protein JWP43_2172 [Ramlibacter sp.]|jgi:maspardin|nr:hypothetical protein [Ramlibacter sp.]